MTAGEPTPASSPGYPPAPWSMRGQLYLSLWRVGGGLVGTAFVDYLAGSELEYGELLRARPTRAGRRAAVTITDIWVDSPASRDGGRALWAIPKGLARFSQQHGPVFRGEARDEHGLLAAAEFTGVRMPGLPPGSGKPERLRGRAGGLSGRPARLGGRLAVRLPGLPVRMPFRSRTRQQRADGEVVVALLSGSARVRLARATWDFPGDGPFADLRGQRPLLSVVLDDFSLRFGG